MTQDQNKYIVRFPDGMRERIKELAIENHRSMNAEIVHHLSRAIYAGAPTKKGDEVSA